LSSSRLWKMALTWSTFILPAAPTSSSSVRS